MKFINKFAIKSLKLRMWLTIRNGGLEKIIWIRNGIIFFHI